MSMKQSIKCQTVKKSKIITFTPFSFWMQSITKCSKIQQIKHNFAEKGCLHHPDIRREGEHHSAGPHK
jgi:hypothetical protein